MPHSFKRKLCPVIGIPVDIGSITSISQEIIKRTENSDNRGGYICVANVHMLTIAQENAKFKTVLNHANLTIPDGMPLVWTQKLKGHRDAQRVCGPDLMIELCNLAGVLNQSIYLLGSNAQTLELLSKKLTALFPKLNIAGMHAPDKLPEEPNLDLALIEKINASGASILFVGLGCPKQEFWCATHAPFLKPIALGVGAAFDFHAGTKSRPPLWMQKNGFEWLYRLISEPKRLWKRYLISNSLFVYMSLKDFIGK
ncbi:WecB/TagA/CpsF family glycosyltransferase [Polynucleobacter asymbioticus]|jgi:N-acetylglucosaminyldiphosphoundecaprenol N-acetyl-beta-D-mannosaminyltransferase|uniref:WecB/TagA/CpsF family glycosyltransferase n=1 Tax=Polynucleobacter asymbioticus TaxID=576611 RepID=UPI0008F877E0|nr:WecB/TagA/CpsF family glycosyltransferase [Polynucleobacter asymbioticus]